MKNVKPKPVLHMAGRTTRLLISIGKNGPSTWFGNSTLAGKANLGESTARLYPSKSGTPVVTYIHSGGHQLPDDVPPPDRQVLQAVRQTVSEAVPCQRVGITSSLGFSAGLSSANTIPHLVNGISGSPFQSPFASPPGEGLSSGDGQRPMWDVF